MTTVRQATRRHAAAHSPAPTPGRPRIGPPAARGSQAESTRRSRRLERRLVREQLLVIAVLALILAGTLVLLGLQWLGTGTPSSAAPALRVAGGFA